MNLSKALALFLSEYKTSTAKTYQQTLSKVIEFLGPSRPLTSIKPVHVVEYASELRNQNYADGSIHKHIKTIKTFFNWCVKMELIERSPAAVIKQKRLHPTTDRDKAMPDEDYEKLLNYLRTFAPYHKGKLRDLALFLFIGDTGCRVGGAAMLKWDEIDWENKTVTLLEKGDKQNVYYFGDDCADALKRWQLRQPPGNQHVWITVGKKPPSPAQVKVQMYRHCEAIGITKRGPHSLRHRKGYQLADAGVPVTVAAMVLNHDNVLTTLNNYYPKDRKLAEEAARRLTHQAKSQPIIVDLKRSAN
jgi:integrase/recombinase XerC